MDQNQLMHLTDAQRQRFRALEQMFESDGWKHIVEFAKAEANSHEQRLINAPSWDVHRFSAGARAAYSVFVGLQEHFENEYAAVAQQAAESKVTFVESDYE